MTGGYVVLSHSKEVHSEDIRNMTSKKKDLFYLISQRLSATTVIEKDILLENVDLEGIKEEDLMVTRALPTKQLIFSQALKRLYRGRDELKLKIEKWEGSSKNLTKILNSQMSAHDKNRLGFGTQIDDLSNKSETDSENSLTVFEVRFSDDESTLANNRMKSTIEDWTSDDEDDVCAVKTVSSIKPNVTQANRSQTDKSECDFYDQKSPELRVKNMVNTGKRVVKPVWDYGKRADRPKDLKPDVKTFGVKNMTTVGTRAVVSKGKVENVLKKAKWVWRPKMNYQDHVYKYNGSYTSRSLSNRPIRDLPMVALPIELATKELIISDYEDLNGGFVAFGSDPKGDELKFNLFSVSQMCDKKNSVLFTESECLILSPNFKLLDESQVVLRAPRKRYESKLWHRRLGHVNFKNINKLVKGHLVRGLPSKVFVNDHTCVACKKGKQHKASCKAKLDRIIRKPLELLHMDLFGPVSIESINKKRSTHVAGQVLNWMFDLDFLTNSINYIPVSVENQVIVDVRTQDSYVAGSSGKDKGPTQEYILLPLQPHRTRIPVKDVVQDAQEQSSENSSLDKGIRTFVSTGRSFVSTDRSNTPNVSAASTSTGANADESSFIYLGGKIPIDASTLPNADLPIDPNMPNLEDAS
ncbi:putative ribonuclease H-like domain-containing protein [Tanacetum coccineum]|uniref:Ribonuclease H-like domain-containing protein n=1 Tax=Tanacetum coccineum TaxID=301880 RepID=A0ABQ5FMV6_9ASTR